MSTSPSHFGAPMGGDQVVDPKDRQPKKSRSKFDLSHKFATTLRFGEISPFLYLPCVPNSTKTVRSAHLLRSFSLESPLLQNLRLKKDFISVPKRALLPRTWDLIYTNPTRGEDIDATQANTLMPVETYANALSYLDPLGLNYDGTIIQFDSVDSFYSYQVTRPLLAFTWRVAIFNSLFAKDSLFATFRIPLHVNETVYDGTRYDSDSYLDEQWNVWHLFLDYLGSVSSKYVVRFGVNPNYVTRTYHFGSGTSTDERDIPERMRFFFDFLEDPYFSNVQPNVKDSSDLDADALVRFNQWLEQQFTSVSSLDRSGFNVTSFAQIFQSKYTESNNSVVNWSSILAYQLSCVELYTNDHVDDVYSVDIFRGFYDTVTQINNTFTINGVSQRYDALSYSNLRWLTSGVSTSDLSDDLGIRLSAILTLVTRRRSLRFVDYFVGARTQPLAVSHSNTLSDIEVTINDNKASVIDITRSIQAQRFLNQVNHVGRRAKDYLKGIFGIAPMERSDVPVMLGSVTESVYGVEVQNTAQAQTQDQNSITSNFQSHADNFAFEFTSREESIIIGVCYFDISRFYDRGFSRFGSEVDRFDMFNPYFQFIGDQPIYGREYDSTGPSEDFRDTSIFGYTARDMQYKTLTDYCTGDFVGNVNEVTHSQNDGLLKSWIFKNDYNLNKPVISSEFIRCYQTELDRYYISHTGLVPSERYNFIVVFSNHVEASEPMAFNPQILG